MKLSLRARLTSVLAVLFLAVGAFLLLAMLRGSRLYFEEVHYRLNRDVSAHVAKSLAAFDGDELDQKELQTLFMDVMRINPSLSSTSSRSLTLTSSSTCARASSFSRAARSASVSGLTIRRASGCRTLIPSRFLTLSPRFFTRITASIRASSSASTSDSSYSG